MNIDNFNMTIEQFVRFVNSDTELQEHWDSTRGDGGDRCQEITDYITGYQGEKHGDASNIIYWLLVEMQVIDPYQETNERIQSFV
jgi:hypothetical protein